MGKFIVIEGIDASGKTEVTKSLLNELKKLGLNCLYINRKNPIFSNSEIQDYSNLLKSIIWREKKDSIPYNFLSSLGWVYQLALWYYFIQENYILPNKDKYDYLIIDGWFYKYYARFLQNKNIDKKLVSKICNTLDNGDKVFLLDIDPEICWERRSDFKMTEITSFGEKVKDKRQSFISFQNKVRKSLIDLKDSRWTICDVEHKSVEEITNDIIDDLRKDVKHVNK